MPLNKETKPIKTPLFGGAGGSCSTVGECVA